MCSERTTWHHFTFLLSGLSQQVGGGHNGRGLYLPFPKIGTSPKTDECYKVGALLQQRGLAGPGRGVRDESERRMGMGIRSLLSLFSFMDHRWNMPTNAILT
jgi:hypothetical protein